MLSRPAPGRLEIVRRLINSKELDLGTDDLVTVEDLVRWLRDNEYAHDSVGGADVCRMRELRDVLTGWAACNHDQTALPAAAVDSVNQLARWCGLHAELTTNGWHLRPARAGIGAVVGDLLGIVAEAQADGTWERLKLCDNATCRWAFYDASRSRRARWCTMDGCGNRIKQAAWRARHAGGVE